MKRYLPVRVVLLALAFSVALFSSTSFAQTSPDAVVKSAVEGTVNAMTDLAARGGDMAKITQLVQTRFMPATDFQRTTRIAVGKAWSTATLDQQKALYEQFQTLLVRIYTSSLSQLRDEDVKFKFDALTLDAGGKDAVVQSHVYSTGGDNPVRYRLEKMPDGWKIYDIDMMGAWLIPGVPDAVRGSVVEGWSRRLDQVPDRTQRADGGVRSNRRTLWGKMTGWAAR
ncbi:MAG: ABC-type transport system involved in resistance to organic solvents, auxiliary component [uncultured Caballeronia sp.]|nr:MAG: ABC-type transport system involved in resistance to organic solvents, auxiliary component [uncultured Caballeronia sp.]